MKFICAQNDINLDAQKIDEFMHRIFSNDKEYQMNKRSVEKQYKRISEKYKKDYIAGLKVSNKAVKIMGML